MRYYEEELEVLIKAGAKGACVMSGFMTCENPKLYIKQFTE